MMVEGRTCEYWDPASCEGSRHCPPRCPRFVDDRGRPWLIRPFEPSDRGPLVETYLDFAEENRTMGLPPLTRGGIERWLDALVEEGCNVVATDGADLVGHAAYTPTDAEEPELAVFVHQAYEGRGIGTELCRHVVATAAAGGRDALVLTVEPRHHRAIWLYTTLDRHENGREPHHSVHPLTMRLPLGGTTGVDVQQSPALRGY